jgi:hypothetical protein
MSEKRERRDARHFRGLTELRIERRADESARIIGTGIVFNSESENLGGFREVIPDSVEIAFAEDLASLFNHDANFLLGRAPGSLKVERTKAGIVYEASPADTAAARDVIALIERGDVRGNSFMFMTRKDRWERLDDDTELRTLLEIEVMEMGPVVFPAYRETDVAVAQRSRERWQEARGLSERERRERELALL